MEHNLQHVVSELATAYRDKGGELSSHEWSETILPDAVWDYFVKNGCLTEADRAFLAGLGLARQLDFEGRDHDA